MSSQPPEESLSAPNGNDSASTFAHPPSSDFSTSTPYAYDHTYAPGYFRIGEVAGTSECSTGVESCMQRGPRDDSATSPWDHDLYYGHCAYSGPSTAFGKDWWSPQYEDASEPLSSTPELSSPQYEECASEALSSTPRLSSQENGLACLVPGCPKKQPFDRSADLDRHIKMAHSPTSEKKSPCDRKCHRRGVPFLRADHFRDHMRDIHTEDLLPRGRKMDQKWWESRIIFDDWWRCVRCLAVQVKVETDGFVCPECKNPCEEDRKRWRMREL
ncbi:hypothetical protein B0H63DRAFT_478043 [Podospora didyma]|uniref:C2H2-type domain-containing protein n=1 Tax=Podospora didyma TaxID=330526 RepID=A0AAE0KJG4_9PEZI|nr:hypothetical protein B0H63DRAFT_478043 [Podospora didyma]